MKELVIDYRFPEDIKRIMKVGIDIGFMISPSKAYSIWSDYSDTFCAGWLNLPQDDETIQELIFLARAAQLDELRFWEGDE